MGNMCRLTDVDSGHDACPPTPVTSCSPNVKCEGLGVARLGDSLAAHGCDDHPTHGRSISGNCSPTVFCNGRAVAKVGSTISCGGSMVAHAATVSVP